MEGVVGERGERSPAQAARAGRAPADRERARRTARSTRTRPAWLLADHLLLEDRRNQRFEHGAAPRDPDAREPACEMRHRGMGSSERQRAPGRARAAPARHRARALLPGPRPRTRSWAPSVLQRDRGRAIRRARRPPGPVGHEPERPVARTAPQRRERASDVERTTERVRSRTDIATILTRPGFVRRIPSNPCRTGFHAMLAKTCDAPGSSRVRRSSLCSPWSPSPAQLARRPQASKRRWIRTSSNAWRSRRLSAGRR